MPECTPGPRRPRSFVASARRQRPRRAATKLARRASRARPATRPSRGLADDVLRVRLGIEAARAAESVPAAEPPALAVRRAARRRRRRQPALGEKRDRAERAAPGRRAAPRRPAPARRRSGRGGDGGDAAALLLRPRPAGVARARDPGRRERRLAGGHRDQGDPAPGRPHLSRAAGRDRGPALPLGADPDHRAARGAAAGAPLHVQPGGDRGDAGQLPVLVVRVRQRRDAAVDRHPLFRLRRRLPAPAGAVAAQGAGDDGVAGRPGRRRDPRPGGDRPGRAQAAAARRVLARHPDLRHARHRARRLRAGDGRDPGPGRRRAADARQRRAAAPVDERAAVDADGRARPR